MYRSLAVAACLIALGGRDCPAAVVRVTAVPLASTIWQPNYLASQPTASPYGLVRTASAAKRLTPAPAPVAAPTVQPAAPPPPSVKPAPVVRFVASLPGAHAPDYRWVVGTLEHDKERGRWYVRYAAAAANDPYGGALELVGVQEVGSLEAGQSVRIVGERIDPAPHQTQPAYRVTAILPVGVVGVK